jgi:hypothetical protein
MLVPKMVKNGLNSSFVVWGRFWASHLPWAFLQCPLSANCAGNAEVLASCAVTGLSSTPMIFHPQRGLDEFVREARIGRKKAKEE